MVDTRADRGTLRKHLKGLGISSVDEYQNWCRNRGIGSGLYKSKVQMEKERNLAKRLNGEAALASTRRKLDWRKAAGWPRVVENLRPPR